MSTVVHSFGERIKKQGPGTHADQQEVLVLEAIAVVRF